MTQFWIFIGFLSFVTGCGYFYLGIKFLHRTGLNSNLILLGWSSILLLWSITPIAYIISLLELLPGKSKSFSLVAFINFGFLTILLFFSIVSDIGFYFYTKIFIPDLANSPDSSISGQSRKDFLLNFINPSILGISGLITGYGIYEATSDWTVESIYIPFSGLSEDLQNIKIVQISDIHVGPTIKKETIEKLVEKVNSLNPDIIAITGDLVDGSVSSLREDVSPLMNLRSKLGTYFVTGNHEYYSGALAWIRELKSLGIKVLLNESDVLSIKNSTLLISGVTDYRASSILPEHATNPEICLVNNEHCDLKILLAHQPKSVFRAAKAGFDLQLSGHTHGGQYFPGNILIYLFQEYVVGLYKHENTWLYVNRGTGYWGPPIRTGNKPEITEIFLQRAT